MMKISELVAELEKIRISDGDIGVNVALSSGALDDLKPSGVIIVHWPEDRKTVLITRSQKRFVSA